MKCVIDLQIAIRCGGGPVVQAEIVDVSPHLASVATFAVHAHPYLWDTFRVSNLESGFCLRNGDAPTKAKAIKMARDFLAGISAEMMGSALYQAGRQLQAAASAKRGARG